VDALSEKPKLKWDWRLCAQTSGQWKRSKGLSVKPFLAKIRIPDGIKNTWKLELSQILG